MKRIICLVLAAALLLTGCGLKKKLDAFGLYSKAVGDIAKAGGMEAECDIKVDLGLLATDITMHLKQNGDDSEVAVYVSGEELSRSVTYDGVTYLNSGGVRTKEPATETDVGSAIPKIAKELFDGAQITENADGRSVTVNIEPETFQEMLAGMSGVSPALSFEDATLTMNFNPDDEITGMDLTSSVEMEFSGITMQADMTVNYRFINLGTAPEILPPDDAEEYSEK